jgi:hypothetical protein
MGPDEQARAVEECRRIESTATQQGVALVAELYRLSVTGPRDELLAAVKRRQTTTGFTDPEGLYLLGSFLARAGAHQEALDLLERAVTGGFHCPSSMREDSYWNDVRRSESFERLLVAAEGASARARETFLRVGGAAVLPVAR